jgi:HD superfamily phosphohydrolase
VRRSHLHFHRADRLLRATALLHDVGHLPFSHTFEGIAGLNHHGIGVDLLHDAAIAGVLDAHGLDPQDIADLLSGRTRSAMIPPPGLLGLDHLDSYVRSARFGARLDIDPARLLAAVQLADGVVSCDLPTARILVESVCAEARLHVSWDNIAPSAALSHLVRRLLDTRRHELTRLARLTDAQLWALLDEAVETRDEAEKLRVQPHLLHVQPADQHPARVPSAWDFTLRKIYRAAPLIDGLPLARPATGAACPRAASSSTETTKGRASTRACGGR